ncbi:cell division septation protein DedD [Lachnospiraceae bacterium PF1-21]|uniref:Uncharacterized protein n=1 Tax=Ohessyouella blattaphilus TaxID=2949333 RepID=A0ABT1EMR3_9FIRM|nr:hypothetical protein [Ohessyouella blattaphilus]MCP1111087.1 hypothetical protein [Ohessyouella blattaphilus]MCR8564481.1 hypothetical protein [Ohessyouella blattaphilus]
MLENSLPYLVYKEHTAGIDLGITREAHMELLAAFKSKEAADDYVEELKARKIRAHVAEQRVKEIGERCR